jgi:hypothetical protein
MLELNKLRFDIRRPISPNLTSLKRTSILRMRTWLLKAKHATAFNSVVMSDREYTETAHHIENPSCRTETMIYTQVQTHPNTLAYAQVQNTELFLFCFFLNYFILIINIFIRMY